MNISKRYLFYLAGTLWIFAGTMVFSIGLRALVRGWAPWEALVAAGIFLLFYFLVFAPIVKKHERRIVSDERAQMPWWAFFDKQGYLFIAAMMPLGIALRLSGFVPQWFFAFFYTGLGVALLICGLQFFYVGLRWRISASLPEYHKRKRKIRMPKKTFYNLPKDKQTKILNVCKNEFEARPLAEVKVSHIVEKLGIARGSFYQYFDDLRECYFTVLKRETTEIHELFLDLLSECDNDIFNALNVYGRTVADELFSPARYELYRNRFLYWTPMLEEAWQTYLQHDPHQKFHKTQREQFYHIRTDNNSATAQEVMHHIKAVTHALVRRIFIENWEQSDFIRHYDIHLSWLQDGLKSDTGFIHSY